MKIVHFYEIGAYKGRTLDVALDQLKDMDISLRVFAFEPFPVYFKCLRKKFGEDKRVNLYQKAIWNAAGELNLYLSSVNKVGHSLYKTKQGVNAESPIQVETITLSSFIKGVKEVPHIRIANVNIEGAEVNMFDDLRDHNMMDAFALYLFSDDEPYPVDVFKVKELASRAPSFVQSLKSAGIRTGKLHHTSLDTNYDIAAFLRRKLQ